MGRSGLILGILVGVPRSEVQAGLFILTGELLHTKTCSINTIPQGNPVVLRFNFLMGNSFAVLSQ